jgi:4'-phosphopantetheinyl transferase
MARLSRGARRLLLAPYLAEMPDALRFEETPHGKPSVSNRGSRLHFSASHSGEVLVFAIAKGRQVGIDVEQLRPRKGASAVAAHFLSSRERECLAALSAKMRTAAFYRCWTQKEAFVKLLGEGLRCPLDRFDVQVDPKQPPAALVGHVKRGALARHARNCVMASVEVPDGYVGTVAVRGRPPVVRQFAMD